MRSLWMVVLTAIGMAAPGHAHAEEPACFGTFVMSEWRVAMDAVDRAVQNGKVALAEKILTQIYDAVPCVDERIRSHDLGRYARQMSVVAHLGQDLDESAQWAQLAQPSLS